MHRGQDWSAPEGTPILAAANGTVELAGPASGFGQWIVIRHEGNYRTVYGHMWNATKYVRAGQTVILGQQIAEVGNNGQSTGAHLHFEVLEPNSSIDAAKRIDPLGWLAATEENVVGTPLGTDLYPSRVQEKGMWNNADNTKQGIVQHTTESEGGNTNVIGYLERNWGTGSYHQMVDFDGEGVRLVPDNKQAWGAMPQGNKRGLHVCAMGRAEWTRERWLQEGKLLERHAQIYAEWNKVHGIPLVRISWQQFKDGVRGVVTHDDISKAFRESDHWDPGTGFPLDVVIKRAIEINGGSPTAPIGDDMANANDVLTQFMGTGPKGWLQLRPYPDNAGKVFSTFKNRYLEPDEGQTLVEALSTTVFEATLRIPPYRGDQIAKLGKETVLGHAAAANGGVQDLKVLVENLTREVAALKAKAGN